MVGEKVVFNPAFNVSDREFDHQGNQYAADYPAAEFLLDSSLGGGDGSKDNKLSTACLSHVTLPCNFPDPHPSLFSQEFSKHVS